MLVMKRGATMGKRDFAHREAKKPKKGNKKVHTLSEFEQPTVVEVVRKPHKVKEEVEE